MAFERSRAILGRMGLSVPALDVAPDNPHIVDTLIAERSRNIVNHPLWPLLRPLLHRVLHYREAVRMADEVAPLSGLEGLAYMSDLLDLSLTTCGTERIPRKGGFVMVVNHPTGVADGIAVFDAIKAVRQDLAIFTNRDAIRVNRRFADILIPVEWRAEFKSTAKARETLVGTNRAVREERAIIIFPSGRIAYWDTGGLVERPWQSSAVALARRHGLPVLPAHLSARNSWMFYLFANWNTELRDMTVFHEVLNKKGKPFAIHFGPVIRPERLDGDLEAVTERLNRHCAVTLKTDPDAEFG
ncbi:MAG: 1-acyl-sn-glycerol-3-phosphate acyltransferase [Pseudomonadota bacterium]|nr:1-acyl-sn-glycerol-3-phosphate acyltransferase [Pseudomonadota bacterium]